MSIDSYGDIAAIVAVVAFLGAVLSPAIVAFFDARQKDKDRKEARRQERVKFLVDALAELWEYYKSFEGSSYIGYWPYFDVKVRSIGDSKLTELLPEDGLTGKIDHDVMRKIFNRIGELTEETQRGDD